MKPLKPLPGQRPLFDECTPELVNVGGQLLTQGVLFGPPESTAEHPANDSNANPSHEINATNHGDRP